MRKRYATRGVLHTWANPDGTQKIALTGPLNIERCPQGHPIIIQAGGSVPGQELSARSADLVPVVTALA